MRDANNLRAIVQAWLAADRDAKANGQAIENLADVYELAAYLARKGLNDPKLWISRVDQAKGAHASDLTTIVNPDDQRQLDPNFRITPLAFAIALFPPGIRTSELPPHTPIAWTRGLQPDGLWSKDSPYPERGGYIVFAGENLERFKTIDGKLIAWAGNPTSDIRKTLPPGTRISEFTFTESNLWHGRRAALFRQLQEVLPKAFPLLLTLGAGFLYVNASAGSLKRFMGGFGGLVCAIWFWSAIVD